MGNPCGDGLLVVWVLAAAEIPHWAVTSLVILFSIGGVLLAIAFLTARHHQKSSEEGLDTARRFVTMARHGLGVMRTPVAAVTAIFFQLIGWLCQLFAVWMAPRREQPGLPFWHAPITTVSLVVLTV